ARDPHEVAEVVGDLQRPGEPRLRRAAVAPLEGITDGVGSGRSGIALLTTQQREERGRARKAEAPRAAATAGPHHPRSKSGCLNAVQPRSQLSTAPVRLRDSSLARKTTRSAISSGVWRPVAWPRSKPRFISSLPKMRAFIGVST